MIHLNGKNYVRTIYKLQKLIFMYSLKNKLFLWFKTKISGIHQEVLLSTHIINNTIIVGIFYTQCVLHIITRYINSENMRTQW